MNSKFTPGPWHVDTAMGVMTEKGEAICYPMMEIPYTITLANAHLISAAPDLFRLLCEARIALQPEFNYSLINDIDKTIAKALGEQG